MESVVLELLKEYQENERRDLLIESPTWDRARNAILEWIEVYGQTLHPSTINVLLCLVQKIYVMGHERGMSCAKGPLFEFCVGEGEGNG